MIDEKFGCNKQKTQNESHEIDSIRIQIIISHSTHTNARIDLVNGPTAWIDHRSAGVIHCPTEIRITNVHVQWQRIASVQFHIIHFPIGKELSILLCIADDARITGARIIAKILVNAEFQTARMNLQMESNNLKFTFFLMFWRWNLRVRRAISCHAETVSDQPLVHRWDHVISPASNRQR